VRTPRGRDIMAACGQLKSESVKERASARLAAEKLASTSLGDVQSGQLARMPQ
jgi:23S rRNA (adenine2503-C2)-methyltransferase